ncbi:hypothetical protein B0J11DRAFT_500943 [Dendryphion nanum]|uniref:Uncharacterized protein n=1 Tax=Dendryphion nanum TaxID=256645 RepID=A0A9P9EFV0_9PLEO|nr:hypothetical protein B0J11DRAFT_500943 [Dendryphion nanum]
MQRQEIKHSSNNAAITNKQVQEAEKEYLFYSGLCQEDQREVMFQIKPEDQPKGHNINTFKFNTIYEFVQNLHMQRLSFTQLSRKGRVIDRLNAKRAFKEAQPKITHSDLKEIKEIINEQRADKKGNKKKDKVADLAEEIAKLVITTEDLVTLSRTEAFSAYLRDPKVYMNCLKRIMPHEPIDNSRNNSSYLTNKP